MRCRPRSGMRHPIGGGVKTTDLQLRDAEVKEEASGEAGCTEVVEGLSQMLIGQCGYGFELDQHHIIHQLVDEELAHDGATVCDVDRMLLKHPEPVFSHLDGMSILVYLLQKPDAEGIADRVGAAQDALCQRVQLVLRVSGHAGEIRS